MSSSKRTALNPLGFIFIELPTVESTNNYAMGMIHEGMAQHGTAVFTHDQTKGKGQRNKSWVSEKDQNIALSLIIEPKPLVLSQVFLLSMTVATGVLHFFNNHVKYDVKVKWPNDIYWCDRKAGGILIENVIKADKWKFAIAGVGLNINQTDFGELNKKAVSLRQITGRKEDPLNLAKELCSYLYNQYDKLLKDPSMIVKEYQEHLYKRNETVKLKQGSRVFEGEIINVTNNGELVVRHSIEEVFKVGEIEWVV
ncbi:MAG: biotin--[acetyl-CoA-carboxylase] ligase [Flavisolibacter sp.]